MDVGWCRRVTIARCEFGMGRRLSLCKPGNLTRRSRPLPFPATASRSSSPTPTRPAPNWSGIRSWTKSPSLRKCQIWHQMKNAPAAKARGGSPLSPVAACSLRGERYARLVVILLLFLIRLDDSRIRRAVRQDDIRIRIRLEFLEDLRDLLRYLAVKRFL